MPFSCDKYSIQEVEGIGPSFQCTLSPDATPAYIVSNPNQQGSVLNAFISLLNNYSYIYLAFGGLQIAYYQLTPPLHLCLNMFYSFKFCVCTVRRTLFPFGTLYETGFEPNCKTV